MATSIEEAKRKLQKELQYNAEERDNMKMKFNNQVMSDHGKQLKNISENYDMGLITQLEYLFQIKDIGEQAHGMLYKEVLPESKDPKQDK